jgi:hypothetical protein
LATNSSKEAQARAEASFKRKELQARDGKLAFNEYNAAGNAMREKTARLKALRLAKEAADQEAAANAPKIVPKAKSAPKAKTAKKK